MLETRIVCKNLPKVFYYPSGIIDKMDNLTKMKVRQEQREYLMKEIERFEFDIEQNEFAYHTESYRLEYGLSQTSVNTELFNRCLNAYLNFRTESSIRHIHYRAAWLRMKLNSPRHRHKSTEPWQTSVYPQVIIEASNLQLTQKELAFLSSEGKRIN